MVAGLAHSSSLLAVRQGLLASRFRQPPHRAPAGGARCDRGSPPAPRHVHAARDRAPARSWDAERHPTLAPASPPDRRCARDSTEARGMDAVALAMRANRKHPGGRGPGRSCVALSPAAQPWRRRCCESSSASRLMHRGVLGAAAAALRLLARRPSSSRSGVRRVAAPPCAAARRSNLAAPPCSAMPSRHVRCLPDQRSPHREVESFPELGTAADQANQRCLRLRLCSSVVQGASSPGSEPHPASRKSRTTRQQCCLSRKAALAWRHGRSAPELPGKQELALLVFAC